LISALLIISLKSVKMGLLSLIPNIAPSMMAFGIWGVLVGMVGLGLSVIISLTIGIVVDDTVHFMSKYLRARRELNKDPQDAVRYSFSTVGTAMWVTTVSLVAGFLVLTFSAYVMNAHMGFMCALTIALALVLDFLFLPTILMKAEE
jgi:predicted RND superfamily exporter protein